MLTLYRRHKKDCAHLIPLREDHGELRAMIDLHQPVYSLLDYALSKTMAPSLSPRENLADLLLMSPPEGAQRWPPASDSIGLASWWDQPPL